MAKKIEVRELLTEMKVALADEFVAEVTEEENGLLLRFVSGQTFRVKVEEIA